MKQNTFSILFLIRKTRLTKKGEAPIQMRITINGRFVELNTQRKIEPANWNQKKERAIGKTPANQEINRYLEWLRTRAYEIQKQLMDKDGYVEPVIIKERLLGKNEECKMFFQVFQEHNDQMAQLVGREFNEITLRRYNLCLRYFKEMLSKETKAEDIPIQNVSGEMIRKFESFLMIEKGVATNTMIRYMKCLKKITNLALANGWITVNPFVTMKFKGKKVVREFLTIAELTALKEKEFSIPRLEIVRDIFLFCSFTGLAFIDVYNLKNEHIIEDAKGRKWIHKQRQKTDVEFSVPLLDLPAALIEKYKDHPICKKSGKILPVHVNQKMNSYLKEIADMCGIKKHLTMHIARYTFATTVTLANNIRLEDVSKMLGHTTTRMTQHYAHVLNDSLAKDMDSIANLMPL